MQGEREGTEMAGEHPLGTNTQLDTSSSEQESSVERKGSCCEACRTLRTILPLLCFLWHYTLVWAWPPCVNIAEKTTLLGIHISHAGKSMPGTAHFSTRNTVYISCNDI